MANRRQHINQEEAAKDAAMGYTVIVLGTICFMLSLAALTAIVRFLVGASAGV